jgi:glycosyltransferase involved in cell wall biosynthesis
MDPAPVLFVHYGEDHIRGSEQVLLDLFANLDCTCVRPLLWCNGSALAQAARAEGVEVFVTPMTYISKLADLRSHSLRLRRQIVMGLDLIRRHGVRLIHANSAAPTQWMVPAARIARVPLLVHLHTAYIRRNSFLMLTHQASMVVGVSAAALDEPRRSGIGPARLRLITNGIDPRRLERGRDIDLRAQLDIPPDAFVVGTAGSLIARKGTAVVLEAFATLPLEWSPWLLVAGDGPDRAELMSLVARLGITGRTTFTGAYRDAGPIFRAMDVHVLASRDEAFGLVLIEAAICGVSNVASEIGGIREVVRQDETGLLVPAGDVAGFAAALLRLATDAGLRRRLATAGRTDAVARFGAAKMAADFQAAYAELLALPAERLGWLGAWRNVGPYIRLVTGRRSGLDATSA